MARVQCCVLSPGTPVKESDMEELITDLTRMRCEGLLARPWLLKSEVMVREVLEGPDNRWDNTIRGKPTLWNAEQWAEAYGFEQKGLLWATRTDKYVQDRFHGKIHRNNGYEIDACKDRRQRQVLAFLVPILYPQKPAQVTITVGNTILGAYSGERPVNWAALMAEVVQKMVPTIGKKPTPLSPFLFHLYHAYDLLTDKEDETYTHAKNCLNFSEIPPGMEPDPRGEPSDTTDSEDEDDTREVPNPGATRAQSRSRSEQAPSRHAEPSTARGDPERREVSSDRGFPVDLFRGIREETHRAQASYDRIETLFRRVCTALGGCLPEEVIREVELLKDAPTLRSEKKRLELQLQELTKELAAKSDEIRKFHAEQEETLGELRKLVGSSGAVINKARLFDENVVQPADFEDKQKIIKILSKCEHSMNMILKKVRQLLNPSTGSPSLVVAGRGLPLPGSPSRAVVGESRGVGFRTPIGSNLQAAEQMTVEEAAMTNRTIAEAIREHQAPVASPGTSTVQQSCAIPTGQMEVTGTTVTERRIEERTVSEQVTRTVPPDVLPRLGEEVIIANYRGEVAGPEWGRPIPPPGRTRVTQEGGLTPSPTAKTGTVTPTPTGTPAAGSPPNTVGDFRRLRKRKEPIAISESDSETHGSSPVRTTGTETQTPTSGTPPAHMIPKSPNSPKPRIVTRLSLEAQERESKAERSARRKAARAAEAGGSEPRVTRSKDREQESHKKTKK
jgi:hypothetical protein